MNKTVNARQFFPLLFNSISTLLKHPQILYPFGILAFIQLMLMQILFFAPRYPLVLVFGPIISRLKGEAYLHYPLNFDLMNHWFQSFQVVVFLFITSYFVGKAVLMIAGVNRGEPIGERMPRLELKKYISIVFVFLLFFLMMYGLTSMYGLLIQRAVQIRSTTGIYFLIKQAVLVGAPYFNLLFSVVITALFAYVAPVIFLEKRNIVVVFARNFQLLWSTFFPVLSIIFLTSLLYVPVLLIKSNQKSLAFLFTPETWQIIVIAGVFIMLLIEAVQYTAITTCYFLTKDE